MKRLVIYSLLFCSLLSVTGCSDFLEKEPPLYITENDVYTDSERLEGAVTGLYLALKDPYFMGGKAAIVIDNIGDEMVNVSGNGYEALMSYEMSVGLTTQENSQTWQYAYLTINKVNTFLKNLEASKEYAGDKYNQYVAEAKFVRAMCYYYLHQIYTMPYKMGSSALSVPLRLNAESDITNNDLARSTSKEVLDQILADLSESDALPSGGNTYSLVTRATQGAAEMLKMRVYMVMEDWGNAIKAGEKVKGYKLLSNVTTVFRSPYISEEAIFSLPMSSTNHPDNQFALGYFYYDGTSIVLDKQSNIMSIPGYGLSEDARISGLTDGVILKKFIDGVTFDDWVPLFRYAETLLDLSECYYNNNEPGKARAALLEVRRRSVPASADPIDIANLSGDALKTAIYNEKRAEFVGEAIRPFDQRRRAETIVKQKGTVGELSVGPELKTNGYIWPIPQSERSQNKLITD